MSFLGSSKEIEVEGLRTGVYLNSLSVELEKEGEVWLERPWADSQASAFGSSILLSLKVYKRPRVTAHTTEILQIYCTETLTHLLWS